MDTEKLFRIIKDVLQDEQILGVVATIDQIRDGLAKNNADGFNTSKNQLAELETKIKDISISYGFSKTEQEILSILGDADFFGSNLISKLASFLTLQGFEGVSKIDEYKANRTAFITRIQKLFDNFTELGIIEYRPNTSEIGIILPKEQGDADTVYRKIKEFEQLIQVIQELVGSNGKKVKIDRVSNGSLEFFTSQPVEVVLVVTTILTNISQICEKIATLKKKKIQTDEDTTLSDTAKYDIKKALDKETQSVKREIEQRLPETIVDKYAGRELESGRKNEIRNHIRAKAKLIFAWFEVGIEVDVIPVRLSDATDNQEAKETLKQVTSTIRETNRLLKKVYSLPPEIKALPFKLDQDQEIDSNDTNATEEITSEATTPEETE